MIKQLLNNKELLSKVGAMRDTLKSIITIIKVSVDVKAYDEPSDDK